MNAASVIQFVVITVVVLAAAVSAARRVFPVTSRRMQAQFAAAFDRPAAPVWLRSLAYRTTPRATTGGSCGDGCSRCGGCGTSTAAVSVPRRTESQPLEFRSRGRS